MGARIAQETVASFEVIVSGINDSSQIVADIAKSSETQSLDIEEIHNGIDHVKQIVEQNSVTAGQSAAASKELTEQSVMLQELMSQFKLTSATS